MIIGLATVFPALHASRALPFASSLPFANLAGPFGITGLVVSQAMEENRPVGQPVGPSGPVVAFRVDSDWLLGHRKLNQVATRPKRNVFLNRLQSIHGNCLATVQ